MKLWATASMFCLVFVSDPSFAQPRVGVYFDPQGTLRHVFPETLVYDAYVVASDLEGPIGGFRLSIAAWAIPLVSAIEHDGTNLSTEYLQFDVVYDECHEPDSREVLVHLQVVDAQGSDSLCSRPLGQRTVFPELVPEILDCNNNPVALVLSPPADIPNDHLPTSAGCSDVNPCCPGLGVKEASWSVLKTQHD